MSHSKNKKKIIKQLNKEQRKALLFIPFKTPPCKNCPALKGGKCVCAKNKFGK